MDIKIDCEKNQLQLDKLLIVRQSAPKVRWRDSRAAVWPAWRYRPDSNAVAPAMFGRVGSAV